MSRGSITARRSSRRRWPWLALGAMGVTSFALGLTGPRAQAADNVVIGLTAVAVSDGMGQTMGDPGAQPYPVAKGDLAHTEATLATGPSGYALASSAWPGPLAANAGSLAVLLAGKPNVGGKEIDSQPVSQANYNGRAEAFSGGPNDATGPSMTAHAEGGTAEATAGAKDVQNSQGQTTGNVYTRSFSEYGAGALRSESTCTASDMNFGAGSVTIGSVHTEANAITRGTSSDAGGRTVVSGMKIAGQDATVDENGVRLTDPATAPIGQQVLANMGMSMYVTKPRHPDNTPSSASYKSGSLVVIWYPPNQGSTNYGYIYEICGSEAGVSVRLDTGYTPPPDDNGVTPDVPGYDVALPETTDYSSSPTYSAPSTPNSSAAPTITAPATFVAAPIAFVRDLSILPYLVGLMCIMGAGIGLMRAQEAALASRSNAVSCPLEGAH